MQGFKGRWVSAQRLARKSGSNVSMIHVTQKETDMLAHYRKGEFIRLAFQPEEFFVAHAILCELYRKTKSEQLAKIIKALEEELFPKPKLVLVGTFHLCHKCYQEINTTVDRYQIRTSEQGDISWFHLDCPVLKPDSERER